jgi:fructoselysine-6-P-deglycase FrlB-like protein
MPRYLDMLNGSMILASSRSGREAELVYALETARREAGATILACSTGEHTEVSQHADIQLELPWAKDEGPYLTRSISSLYLVNLYNLGLLAGDVALVDEIKTATDGMEAFITSNTPAIQKIAEDSSWERVIILADGELQGLACAGAEVIRSLAGVPAWHSHMLDSRHVFSPSFFDDKALVIAVLSPEEDEHQTNCLNELHATGARIITLSARDELPTPGVSMNIALPAVRSVANWGYNFLFTTQALAYFRSGI